MIFVGEGYFVMHFVIILKIFLHTQMMFISKTPQTIYQTNQYTPIIIDYRSKDDHQRAVKCC